MAPLKNLRHERFAQLVHKYGGNARKAYSEAGFKARGPRTPAECSPLDRNASRLLKSAEVKHRVDELQAVLRKRHDYSVDALLDELDAARTMAHEKGQSGAAVAATMAKAKLLGFLVERREIGQPGDFDGLKTLDEVIDYIRNELGQEAAGALAGLLGARDVE